MKVNAREKKSFYGENGGKSRPVGFFGALDFQSGLYSVGSSNMI